MKLSTKIITISALIALALFTMPAICEETEQEQQKQTDQKDQQQGEAQANEIPEIDGEEYTYDDIDDEEEIFTKKAFIKQFNLPESKNKEVQFIKQTFTTNSTTLNKEQYSEFVLSYLKWNVHEIMGDVDHQEQIQKTYEHYKGLALAFMEDKTKNRDTFDLNDVYRDVIAGRIMSYVHDFVDHESVEHDDDLAEDDEL